MIFDPENISWMHEARFAVSPPARPGLLGPKARAFLVLCVLAVVCGALLAAGLV